MPTFWSAKPGEEELQAREPGSSALRRDIQPRFNLPALQNKGGKLNPRTRRHVSNHFLSV